MIRKAALTARLVAALAAGLAFAAAPPEASAQEAYERGAIRTEIEAALAAGGPEQAAQVLDRVLRDAAPRSRARDVEAADAAWQLLPRPVAAPYAARLLAAALRKDPGNQDGAWDAVQKVRRELFRSVDVANGVPLLRDLAEIYPNVLEYRRDLATLLLDGGRRDEAREVLEVLARMAPSDTGSAYQLAVLAEEDGDLDGAVAQYDRILRERPQELRAHLIKARVLAPTDPDRARAALADLEAAADASPSEADRASYLEQAARERRDLDRREADRGAILVMLDRIRWTTWAALAGWIVVAWVLALLTRPVRADGPDGPAGRAPAPSAH